VVVGSTDVVVASTVVVVVGCSVVVVASVVDVMTIHDTRLSPDPYLLAASISQCAPVY